MLPTSTRNLAPLWTFLLLSAVAAATAWSQEPQVTNQPRLVAQTGHTGSVLSVCFSPDERQVLTRSEDNTARLWDATTGKELRRFVGHGSYVRTVCFSPDGRRVLTGSGSLGGKDNTARIWDAITGRELRRFEGHSDDVSSVSFSPDGRHVLTGSADDSARLWDAGDSTRTRLESWRFAFHQTADRS
jgi:WD40 repeat protein